MNNIHFFMIYILFFMFLFSTTIYSKNISNMNSHKTIFSISETSIIYSEQDKTISISTPVFEYETKKENGYFVFSIVLNKETDEIFIDENALISVNNEFKKIKNVYYKFYEESSFTPVHYDDTFNLSIITPKNFYDNIGEKKELHFIVVKEIGVDKIFIKTENLYKAIDFGTNFLEKVKLDNKMSGNAIYADKIQGKYKYITKPMAGEASITKIDENTIELEFDTYHTSFYSLCGYNGICNISDIYGKIICEVEDDVFGKKEIYFMYLTFSKDYKKFSIEYTGPRHLIACGFGARFQGEYVKK